MNAVAFMMPSRCASLKLSELSSHFSTSSIKSRWQVTAVIQADDFSRGSSGFEVHSFMVSAIVANDVWRHAWDFSEYLLPFVGNRSVGLQNSLEIGTMLFGS